MKTLKQLGEFNFIAAIAKNCKKHRSVIKGIGDDAAVVRFTKDKQLLFTVDMLIEDVHFLRTHKPQEIGHKALACSISDIAAMGGTPNYALVSVSLPKSLSINYAKRIYQGMQKTADKFSVAIIGGDTNSCEKIIIDVFVCGTVQKKRLVKRDTAKSGDSIFVTGSLGSSQNGRHLRFTPRLEQALFLTKNFPLSAMIDITDGLASDLGHIVEDSKKSALLFKHCVPVAKKCSMKDAFYAGEDFELLFTAPKHYKEQILKKWPFHKKVRLSCIGRIEKGKGQIKLVDKLGNILLVEKGGYRHF